MKPTQQLEALLSKANAQQLQNISISEIIADEDGIFRFGNSQIIPVERSTFKTVNFQSDSMKGVSLYSTELSACSILLIKNFNEETKKYDNVVTMAHFFPNNAYDEKQTVDNLALIFKDFKDKGGEFNENTSVILIAGATKNIGGEDLHHREQIKYWLENELFKKRFGNYKFNAFDKSITNLETNPTKTSYVFVDENQTLICTKEFPSDKLKIVATKSQYNESEVDNIINFFNNGNYSEFFNKRSNQINSESSNGVCGMTIIDASEIIEEYNKICQTKSLTSQNSIAY